MPQELVISAGGPEVIPNPLRKPDPELPKTDPELSLYFAPLHHAPWFADKARIAVPRSLSETLSTAKGLLT
jgi:hypothetical protein